MNRNMYKTARRLVRDNGNSALEWMTPKVREEMTRVVAMKKKTDWLAERLHIVTWCKADGVKVTPAHTRPDREYRNGKWMGFGA